MRKSKLTPDPDNIKLVTINEWGLPKSDEIMRQIKEAVRIAASEAIAYSLAENVSFNFEFDRPLIGRVSLPITDSETCDGPSWEIDLRREFELVLEYHESQIDDITKMRDELVLIVDRFTEIINRHARRR